MLPVLSMPAALCLNRDLRIIQMYIISSALPIRGSATYDLREVFFYQAATEYVYVCEYICTCACIHVFVLVYECMHIYTCNKCVIENTTQLPNLQQITE